MSLHFCWFSNILEISPSKLHIHFHDRGWVYCNQWGMQRSYMAYSSSGRVWYPEEDASTSQWQSECYRIGHESGVSFSIKTHWCQISFCQGMRDKEAIKTCESTYVRQHSWCSNQELTLRLFCKMLTADGRHVKILCSLLSTVCIVISLWLVWPFSGRMLGKCPH